MPRGDLRRGLHHRNGDSRSHEPRRHGFVLTDDEAFAVHELVRRRSSFHQSPSSNRTLAVMAAMRRIVRTLLRFWKGDSIDRRLERVGDVLVHDHSDRQFVRLVANERNVDVVRVAHTMRFLSARGSIRVQWAAIGAVLRNARRSGLLSGGMHSSHVAELARALVIAGALNKIFADPEQRPRALMVSGDFDLLRAVLGFVATRSSVPMGLVLHDYGSGWGPVAEPWMAAFEFRWVLAHDVSHAARLPTPPGVICLFPTVAVGRPRGLTDRLRVGIVVCAVVSTVETLSLASKIAMSPRVERVLVRRHPRSRGSGWSTTLPDGVEYADRDEDVVQFAHEVDVVIASETTARHRLMRAGVPCFWWGGFYRGTQFEIKLAPDPSGLSDDNEFSRVLGVTLSQWTDYQVSSRYNAMPVPHSSSVGQLLNDLGFGG